MNIKRYVYWIALVLVFSTWFANNPIKKALYTPISKPQAEVTKALKDPMLLGVAQDQWVVGGKCNLEQINGMPMTTATHNLTKNIPLQLTGWAMDIDKIRLPESIIVRFLGKDNSNYFALAKIGFVRTDVRDYFKATDALVLSGFETNINLHDLPEGEFKLTLIMKFTDVVYTCDNGRKISVM